MAVSASNSSGKLPSPQVPSAAPPTLDRRAGTISKAVGVYAPVGEWSFEAFRVLQCLGCPISGGLQLPFCEGHSSPRKRLAKLHQKTTYSPFLHAQFVLSSSYEAPICYSAKPGLEPRQGQVPGPCRKSGHWPVAARSDSTRLKNSWLSCRTVWRRAQTAANLVKAPRNRLS